MCLTHGNAYVVVFEKMIEVMRRPQHLHMARAIFSKIARARGIQLLRDFSRVIKSELAHAMVRAPNC